MYAVIVQYVLGPNTQWEADHVFEAANIMLRQQKGFRELKCLVNYEIGECTLIGFWDSMDDIERAYTYTHSHGLSLIGDKYQWPGALQVFKVYEPKLANINPSID